MPCYRTWCEAGTTPEEFLQFNSTNETIILETCSQFFVLISDFLWSMMWSSGTVKCLEVGAGGRVGAYVLQDTIFKEIPSFIAKKRSWLGMSCEIYRYNRCTSTWLFRLSLVCPQPTAVESNGYLRPHQTTRPSLLNKTIKNQRFT